MAIIIKITDGTDIRRFTASTESLTFSTIYKNASEAFGLGAKAFKLKYKDDEGDQITMSTDRELADAVAYTKTLEPPVLRLTLEANRTRAEGGSQTINPKRAEGASQTSNPKPANNTANNTAAPSADLDALLANIKAQLPASVNMNDARLGLFSFGQTHIGGNDRGGGGRNDGHNGDHNDL